MKKKPPDRKQDKVVCLAVTTAYHDWITAFAEQDRSTMSALVDRAVEAYAVVRGYPPPPPRW